MDFDVMCAWLGRVLVENGDDDVLIRLKEFQRLDTNYDVRKRLTGLPFI